MKKKLCVAGSVFLTVLFALSCAASGDRVQEEKTQAEDSAQESFPPVVDASMNIMPGSRIAVVSKNTRGDFWKQIRSGMGDALKEVNDTFGLSGNDKITMTFEGPGDEKEVENQINTLDAVIAENPDVLCLCAGDMDSCQAQLEAAAENGIPVVVFDSHVADMGLVSAYRATDNYALGRLAGEKLADAMEHQGGLIVFSAQEKTSTSRERVDGLMQALKEFPEIEVCEVIYDDQVEDMAAAMQEAIRNHPEADAVYCTNDNVSDLFLGLPEDGNRELLFVGTDASRKQQEAIREGREYGCLAQDPYLIGSQTIVAAAELTGVDGEENVEAELLMDPIWIDGSNIDNPENRRYLY